VCTNKQTHYGTGSNFGENKREENEQGTFQREQ
jgi:hypothetical protein